MARTKHRTNRGKGTRVKGARGKGTGGKGTTKRRTKRPNRKQTVRQRRRNNRRKTLRGGKSLKERWNKWRGNDERNKEREVYRTLRAERTDKDGNLSEDDETYDQRQAGFRKANWSHKLQNFGWKHRHRLEAIEAWEAEKKAKKAKEENEAKEKQVELDQLSEGDKKLRLEEEAEEAEAAAVAAASAGLDNTQADVDELDASLKKATILALENKTDSETSEKKDKDSKTAKLEGERQFLWDTHFSSTAFNRRAKLAFTNTTAHKNEITGKDKAGKRMEEINEALAKLDHENSIAENLDPESDLNAYYLEVAKYMKEQKINVAEIEKEQKSTMKGKMLSADLPELQCLWRATKPTKLRQPGDLASKAEPCIDHLGNAVDIRIGDLFFSFHNAESKDQLTQRKKLIGNENQPVYVIRNDKILMLGCDVKLDDKSRKLNAKKMTSEEVHDLFFGGINLKFDQASDSNVLERKAVDQLKVYFRSRECPPQLKLFDPAAAADDGREIMFSRILARATKLIGEGKLSAQKIENHELMVQAYATIRAEAFENTPEVLSLGIMADEDRQKEMEVKIENARDWIQGRLGDTTSDQEPGMWMGIINKGKSGHGARLCIGATNIKCEGVSRELLTEEHNGHLDALNKKPGEIRQHLDHMRYNLMCNPIKIVLEHKSRGWHPLEYMDGRAQAGRNVYVIPLDETEKQTMHRRIIQDIRNYQQQLKTDIEQLLTVKKLPKNSPAVMTRLRAMANAAWTLWSFEGYAVPGTTAVRDMKIDRLPPGTRVRGITINDYQRFSKQVTLMLGKPDEVQFFPPLDANGRDNSSGWLRNIQYKLPTEGKEVVEEGWVTLDPDICIKIGGKYTKDASSGMFGRFMDWCKRIMSGIINKIFRTVFPKIIGKIARVLVGIFTGGTSEIGIGGVSAGKLAQKAAEVTTKKTLDVIVDRKGGKKGGSIGGSHIRRNTKRTKRRKKVRAKTRTKRRKKKQSRRP